MRCDTTPASGRLDASTACRCETGLSLLKGAASSRVKRWAASSAQSRGAPCRRGMRASTMSDVKCGTRTSGATEHPANRLPHKGNRDRQNAGATIAGGSLQLDRHVAAALTTRGARRDIATRSGGWTYRCLMVRWFRRDLVIWDEHLENSWSRSWKLG